VSYLALLVASYYPISTEPWGHVTFIGDSLESAYIVAWNAHQVLADPWHLYDANILFPQARALAFTDHRFLPSALAAPVLWISGNPILAFNAAVAIGLLLAAFGARRLALALGLDEIGAWAVGALYAFHTRQISEVPRLNLLFNGLIPLALEQLIRLLGGDRRAAWRLAGLMLALGYCSNYLLLYGALLLGIVLAGVVLARPRTFLPRIAGLILPTVVAAILFLPVALPYLSHFREHGLRRELPEGITLAHYAQTLPTNLLYGPVLPDLVPRHRANFLGFVTLLLVSGAVVFQFSRFARAWQRPAPGVRPALWVPSAAILALLFVALSLGREIQFMGESLPGPYVLLYHWLPGFTLVRFPERLALLAMLFVALLAGRALSLIRWRGLGTVACVLAVLMPLEHLSPRAWGETPIPVGSGVPTVYRWLAGQPVRCLLELPIGNERQVRMETLNMYFSTYNFKPLLQGYTAFPPPLSLALRQLALRLPEHSLRALARAGVDTIVVHLPSAGTLAQYEAISDGDGRRAFARHFQLEDVGFYKGIRRLHERGALVEIARFDRGPTFIAGGQDVVYRVAVSS